MKKENEKELKVFNNQYAVLKKLSAGSFGIVFKGLDKKNDDNVAIKVERREYDKSSLEHEVIKNRQTNLQDQSQVLARLQGLTGIPQLFWNGIDGNYNVMVIELLGRDLAYYIKHLKRFTLKTVLMLADKLLTLLEQIHNKSIIHRDLKPENILVGLDPRDIYIADYGISKIYRDSKGTHIAFKEGKAFVGTTRYASINAHKGLELGRADDLESLGYILIYLYKGSLPWQNLQNVQDHEKTKIVGNMKMQFESKFNRDLCSEMPLEFIRYLDYVKKMHFKSQPDYKFLQSLFKKTALQNNIEYDSKYDWVTDEQMRMEKKKKLQVDEPKSPINQAPSIMLPESSLINVSQFDFLKPPVRGSDKRKTISSFAASSQYSSNQDPGSSIVINYQQQEIHSSRRKQNTQIKKNGSQASFQLFESKEKLHKQDTFLDMEEEPPNLEERLFQLKQSSVNAQFKDKLKYSLRNGYVQ